jgi:5-carboxymethyl-2-hydroxymuconate isomerase
MPHLIVEYSANLEAEVDIAALVAAVHAGGLACPTVQPAALRTRAARREHWQIADGDPAWRFVALTARLLAGRTAEEKADIADILFAALERALEGANPSGLALSLEIVEIDPATYRKRHDLAELLAAKARARAAD